MATEARGELRGQSLQRCAAAAVLVPKLRLHPRAETGRVAPTDPAGTPLDVISISDFIVSVSRKHRRILEAIFRRPTVASLRWADFASLVKALGGELSERAGSRVAVVLRDRVLVLHRPHPGNELRKYAVEDIRDFLTAAGVTP